MSLFDTQKPLNATAGWVFHLLAVLILICLIVPLAPAMPAAGLDPSWMLAINQAVAQGLSFGREVVFTFGPYAAIYTHLYHPATDAMALFGAAHVVLGFWLALFALTRRATWPAMVILLMGLVLLSWSRDALFLAYPVLVALVCHQLVADMAPGETSTGPLLIYMALVFSVLGLLPLVKGSMLLACVSAASICAWVLMLRSDWRLLLVLLLTPCLTVIAYWLAAGQQLYDIKQYVLSMANIVSGYTDAMSRKGFIHEIVLYVVAAAGLLWHVWRHRRAGLGLVFIFGPALFLAFKAGYVRHDSHAVATAVFLLFMCVLIIFLQRKSISKSIGLAGVAALSLLLMLSAVSVYSIKPDELKLLVFSRAKAKGVDVAQFNGLPRSQQLHLMSQTLSFADVMGLISRSWAMPFSFSPLWQGAQLRLVESGALDVQYRMRLAALSQEAPLPQVQGTADMYFSDQSVVIASGIRWNPRPVFQSYSAYLPDLLKRNQAHLHSSGAPDHLFVRLDTMDNRWPAAEDGLSWLTWLLDYESVQLRADMLHLQRHRSEQQRDERELMPQLTPLLQVHAKMGEPLDVPPSKGLLLVSMVIEPTWTGRLFSLLYQSNPLEVQIFTRDGQSAKFRLIPGQLKTDVLLSPLVADSQQLARLFDGPIGLESLAGKQVKRLTVSTVGGAGHWQPEFLVQFKQIAAPRSHSKT